MSDFVANIYRRAIGGAVKQALEYRQVASLLNSSRKGISLAFVYDNLVSPPTYGDLLVFLMLVRTYAKLSRTSPLVLIQGDKFRNDWWGNHERNAAFLTEQYNLAVAILGDTGAEVKIIYDWDHCQALISDASPHSRLFWPKNVFQRLPVYHCTFNIVNKIVKFSDLNRLTGVFLSTDLFGRADGHCLAEKEFYSIGVRYNLDWGVERNSSLHEIDALCSIIHSADGSKPVVIFSDQAGCDFFADKLRYEKYYDRLLFSRDISSTFTDDLVLLLRSTLHMQIRGGGINVVPIFSLNPYFIVQNLCNERPIGRYRLTQWQTSNQYFCERNRPDQRDFRGLELLLSKL